MIPRHLVAAGLLACAALSLVAGPIVRGIVAEPIGPPPAGPDLRAAFRRPDGDAAKARIHAAAFAEINAALADAIEYDAAQTPPAIRTGAQLDEIRRTVRAARMRGLSFVAEYPALAPILETHFGQAVGQDGGPIDDARRAAWITAFRSLAACATYAANAGHLVAAPTTAKSRAAAIVALATQEPPP